MPEAAMHKHYRFVSWQNDIRVSRQIFHVESEPIAETVKH